MDAENAYIDCNKRKTKECDLLPIREAELKSILGQIAGNTPKGLTIRHLFQGRYFVAAVVHQLSGWQTTADLYGYVMQRRVTDMHVHIST